MKIRHLMYFGMLAWLFSQTSTMNASEPGFCKHCGLKEEKYYQIECDFFDKIKERCEELETIQTLTLDVVGKWARLLAVVLPIQYEVLYDHGYSPDPQGLMQFSEDAAQLCDKESRITKKQLAIFDYMTEKALGVVIQESLISKDMLDTIMEELLSAVYSLEYARSLKELIEAFPLELDEESKRDQIMRCAYSLESEILRKYGFQDVHCRLRLSRSLIEHYFGASWKRKLIKAQKEIAQEINSSE